MHGSLQRKQGEAMSCVISQLVLTDKLPNTAQVLVLNISVAWLIVVMYKHFTAECLKSSEM